MCTSKQRTSAISTGDRHMNCPSSIKFGTGLSCENSPTRIIFPAGEGGCGQMMYRSPERSPQDSRDGTFLYSAQASFSWPRVDLARLLRRAYSQSVWIISFEFVKVCGIRFSIWESFIGFYICCYPISTILTCLERKLKWKMKNTQFRLYFFFLETWLSL